MAKIYKKGLVYKLTYSNGKIYIGCDYLQDRKTNTDQTYFGSPTNPELENDYPLTVGGKPITVTKEILAVYENITVAELRKFEDEFIVSNESNNPEKGYNLLPSFKYNC